jgi:hypothetical protein
MICQLKTIPADYWSCLSNAKNREKYRRIEKSNIDLIIGMIKFQEFGIKFIDYLNAPMATRKKIFNYDKNSLDDFIFLLKAALKCKVFVRIELSFGEVHIDEGMTIIIIGCSKEFFKTNESYLIDRSDLSSYDIFEIDYYKNSIQKDIYYNHPS